MSNKIPFQCLLVRDLHYPQQVQPPLMPIEVGKAMPLYTCEGGLVECMTVIEAETPVVAMDEFFALISFRIVEGGRYKIISKAGHICAGIMEVGKNPREQPTR